jgi:hypothetical protein
MDQVLAGEDGEQQHDRGGEQDRGGAAIGRAIDGQLGTVAAAGRPGWRDPSDADPRPRCAIQQVQADAKHRRSGKAEQQQGEKLSGMRCHVRSLWWSCPEAIRIPSRADPPRWTMPPCTQARRRIRRSAGHTGSNSPLMIQGVPKRSTSMPKRLAQNDGAIAIVTRPPLASASKAASASAVLS